MGDDPRIASRPVSPELLGKILEEEQALKEYPGHKPGDDPKYAEELGYSSCDCPKCRARRGGPVDDGYVYMDDDEDEDEDFDDGDEFDQEDSFVGPGTSSIPGFLKGIGKLMGLSDAAIKELKKAYARGENPQKALDRILGETFSQPGSPASSLFKKKEKAAKALPPDQGSLF
jgi:hypothetical protein